MVAIFTGSGTGFERGSASVLGAAGLLGQSSLGRNGEQVMLNAANGNLLISQRDEFLVGRGPDAAISRTYNSLGRFTDDNGDNWRQSTARRITWSPGPLRTTGSTVTQHLGDGSEKIYRWTGVDYLSNEGGGAADTLVQSGSQWTWTDGAGLATETYEDYFGESSGGYARLIRQSDTSGNSLTFSYQGRHVSEVRTADGGWIRYGYSGDKVATITAGYRDLVAGVDGVEWIRLAVTGTSADVWKISYDGAKFEFRKNDVVFHSRSAAADLDLVFKHRAVTAGAVIRDIKYDETAQLARVTDAAGHASSYVYDARGNVVTETDRLGNVIRRTWGLRNELLTETRVGSDWEFDQKEHTTRYVYDDASRLRFKVR